MIIKQGPHESINQIKKYNADQGYHYFEKGTMDFFNSITMGMVFAGRIFITSEKFMSPHGNGPRRWSLRYIDDDGSIGTIGDFQRYTEAHEAISDAAEVQSIIDFKGEYNANPQA
jgi:hypothetical protein